MSLKYNAINCLLEILGFLIVTVPIRTKEISPVLYVLFTFTATPLVYYLSMENMRKLDEQEAKSKVRIFDKRTKYHLSKPKAPTKADIELVDIEH